MSKDQLCRTKVRGPFADRVKQQERERQDQLNRIIRDVTNNTVLTPNFPPSGVDEPRVLECGVGKGAWIEDLLEEYDDCEV